MAASTGFAYVPPAHRRRGNTWRDNGVFSVTINADGGADNALRLGHAVRTYIKVRRLLAMALAANLGDNLAEIRGPRFREIGRMGHHLVPHMARVTSHSRMWRVRRCERLCLRFVAGSALFLGRLRPGGATQKEDAGQEAEDCSLRPRLS